MDNLTQIIALFREQNALIERLITMADGDFIISDTPLESLPSVTLPTSRPIRTNIAQNHAMAIAKRRMEKATVNHSNHQENLEENDSPSDLKASYVEKPGESSFEDDLIALIAAKTGYPKEMIDKNANLEADLGVDSIKKVEIFTDLLQKYSHLQSRDEEKILEDLSSLRTIASISQWYEKNKALAA